MRKLTNEEIKALNGKQVIELFSNFHQLLNRENDQKMLDGLHTLSFPIFIAPSYYDYGKKDPTDESAIYDLGEGYYLFINECRFQKGAAKELKEKPFEFKHTTAIYKIAE